MGSSGRRLSEIAITVIIGSWLLSFPGPGRRQKDFRPACTWHQSEFHHHEDTPRNDISDTCVIFQRERIVVSIFFGAFF